MFELNYSPDPPNEPERAALVRLGIPSDHCLVGKSHSVNKYLPRYVIVFHCSFDPEGQAANLWLCCVEFLGAGCRWGPRARFLPGHRPPVATGQGTTTANFPKACYSCRFSSMQRSLGNMFRTKFSHLVCADWIFLDGDLGSNHQIMNNTKPHVIPHTKMLCVWYRA